MLFNRDLNNFLDFWVNIYRIFIFIFKRMILLKRKDYKKASDQQMKEDHRKEKKNTIKAPFIPV